MIIGYTLALVLILILIVPLFIKRDNNEARNEPYYEIVIHRNRLPDNTYLYDIDMFTAKYKFRRYSRTINQYEYDCMIDNFKLVQFNFINGIPYYVKVLQQILPRVVALDLIEYLDANTIDRIEEQSE